MRYMDSGDRRESSTLLSWMQVAFESATIFRCQTAYFSADGLYAVEGPLRRLLEGGGSVQLILGGHEGTTRVADLEYLLEFARPYPQMEIAAIVPGATGLLIHSKVYHITLDDGRQRAWVGSANWTSYGLVANLEAGIALDSADGDRAVTAEIGHRIDEWFDGTHPHAANLYRVTSERVPQLIGLGVASRTATGEQTPRTGPPARVEDAAVVPPLPTPLSPPRRPRRGFAAGRAHGAGEMGVPAAGAAVGSDTRVAAGAGVATLPPEIAAVVKVITRNDLRGLRGLAGTSYVSPGLPKQVFFPDLDADPDRDPRRPIVIEARFAARPDAIAHSWPSPANLQLEGAARHTRTNVNLRMNLLRALGRELNEVADRSGIAAPSEGDLLVMQFVEGTPLLVRLTLVLNSDAQYSRLASRIGQGEVAGFGRAAHFGTNYGWLTDADLAALPSW